MSKATITRLFVGSVVAVVAGAVLAFAAVWIAYTSGAFVMSGPDVTGIQPTPYAWAIVALAVVAALAFIGGFQFALPSPPGDGTAPLRSRRRGPTNGRRS